MVKEDNTSLISSKKKIDIVVKTDKSQTSKGTVDTSKNNKTDTLNTIYKSRPTPRTNLSNKSTKIENPSEIDMHRDNLIVSVLSGQGESLSSATPDNLRIPRKNKGKKTPENSVIRKEPILYKANPRKRAK